MCLQKDSIMCSTFVRSFCACTPELHIQRDEYTVHTPSYSRFLGHLASKEVFGDLCYRRSPRTIMLSRQGTWLKIPPPEVQRPIGPKEEPPKHINHLHNLVALTYHHLYYANPMPILCQSFNSPLCSSLCRVSYGFLNFLDVSPFQGCWASSHAADTASI